MKIKTKGFFGAPQTEKVENFVNECVFYSDDHSSFGRLVEILAQKGQLSAEEVYFIANGYDGIAEFVKE